VTSGRLVTVCSMQRCSAVRHVTLPLLLFEGVAARVAAPLLQGSAHCLCKGWQMQLCFKFYSSTSGTYPCPLHIPFGGLLHPLGWLWWTVTFSWVDCSTTGGLSQWCKQAVVVWASHGHDAWVLSAVEPLRIFYTLKWQAGRDSYIIRSSSAVTMLIPNS
jgi:hypothetical protein